MVFALFALSKNFVLLMLRSHLAVLMLRLEAWWLLKLRTLSVAPFGPSHSPGTSHFA